MLYLLRDFNAEERRRFLKRRPRNGSPQRWFSM
jgi:hypothetical protein